ncbi:GNAT family N-acetyltransferase [Streptomyces winkii]|uniref:GNAT family N-acetyltransferase n=1 Tax=Streptomyces winkii TaxID=3051178 RepID=UPI0028D4F3F0|nr:GNAT family N-acetyltransferase [Streptomyces sp. DSM 40971]
MPVREMTTADVGAVAELRVRAWQSAYRDLLPDAFLDAMSVEEDAARRRETFARTEGTVANLVTERADGTVTGWAAIGPDRPGGIHTHIRTQDEQGPGECAELYAIYVLPGLVGTGLGRALTAACLEWAAQRGFTRAVLWVIEGNTRARRFYERAGFAPDGTQETYDLDGRGTHVPIVRYARPLPLTGSGAA